MSTVGNIAAAGAGVGGGVQVFDLAHPYRIGMPQSPNHPAFWHTLPRRHGDSMRADGSSAANDLICTGTHVGTHIDALCHVSYQGKLADGSEAAEAQTGGRFPELGVHTIEPMACRGVLLDIPRALGLDECPADFEVTPDHLEATADAQGTEVGAGDVVLVRTGWCRRFDEGESFVGRGSGTPGVGEAGARWLAERKIRAAGGETPAFEHLPAGAGHALLPAHRVLLVETGIYIIEALVLEELAKAEAHEFAFIAAPLKLSGATGSPIRPLAVVADG